MAYKKKTADHSNKEFEKGHMHQTPLMNLFPNITPYASGFLELDDIHNMYWEQSGNPDGVPIVLLHGGPGAGTSPEQRRFFDPDYYRIILFDQRGSGRSTPLGCLIDNTTDHLVNDLEVLRNHLSVDRWHLFGGSWGSTLALAYAIQYPERCMSMILRGMFLCEAEEIEWFLYGMGTIFPEAWQQFSEFLPDDEQNDLLNGYYKRLTGDNSEEQMNAAICWSLYEGACSSIIPNYETITTDEQKQHALSLARIEAHYFKHEVRTKENSLLNHLDKIRHIPSTIVQGRYDVICPIKTAYNIHQLWPEADYISVPDAGHAAFDPTLRSRLIEVTEATKHMRI